MANVFGILTAIVLALAGFVAYKNKAAYETEITNTDTEKGRLKASQQRFDEAKNSLADTIEKRTGVDSEVVKLTDDEASQKKVNDELTSQIKTKTDKAAANKEQLDTIRDKTVKVGDLKELAPKMTAAKAELEELSQSISSTEAKLANLTAQNTQTEGQANAIKGEFDIIASVQSLPKVNTRIRSIYPTWGFVTLAAGNDAGVVANSTLDVVRDGSTVAKLLVTAVERNSSSASIIPDSIGQDVTLMVGDRVVPAQKAVQPAKN
jgi:archaellum component FlaG (FlaF/FlaG flagellin family)